MNSNITINIDEQGFLCTLRGDADYIISHRKRCYLHPEHMCGDSCVMFKETIKPETYETPQIHTVELVCSGIRIEIDKDLRDEGARR